MLMTRMTGVLLFIALLFAGGENSTVSNGLRLTGTFTNLEYHDESGDLTGQEVRIVLGRNGYQATIQFGEGEPSDLILVDVSTDNAGHIEFSIPALDAHAGSFKGRVNAECLTGTFTSKGGAEKPMNLKRTRSYWD